MYKYHIIAQKLPMLKQGLKTIKAEFIRTRALSQLFLSISDLMQPHS